LTSPNPSNAEIRDLRKAFKEKPGRDVYFNIFTGEIDREKIGPIGSGWCVLTDAFFPVYGSISGMLGFQHGKEFEKVSL
jgi:hypothetical protein